MRILACDTATASATVAAIQGQDLCAEVCLAGGQTHSRHLMDLVVLVLRHSGWSLKDIDGFAVTCGPGSFTGLRIGLATVKGLSLALGKPVAGISTLDALAAPCRTGSMPVYALIDARKDEVYWARYRERNGVLQREGCEAVAPLEAVIATVAEPACFVGNGALRWQAEIISRLGKRARLAPASLHTVRGYTVALLGREQLIYGQTGDPGELMPRYVRKADAGLNPRPGGVPGLPTRRGGNR